MKWQLLLLVCVVASCSGRGRPNPQTKGFIDWINQLIGGTTTTTTLRPINDPPENCPPCQCGIPRTRRRIVGGHETKKLVFPWLVELLYGGRFYCGGTLVNDLYVMTAAHCTAGFRMERMTARFLEHDRSVDNETKTFDRKISAIIRHLRYNPSTYDNDIALLKLDKRVDLSNALKRIRRESESEASEAVGGESEGESGVSESTEPSSSTPASSGSGSEEDNGLRPICLASHGVSYTNYSAVVAGWGTTEEGGSVSNTLQEVYVPIMSNEDCRNTAYKNRITENMLCAGELTGGRDACQGDSGGPLHVLNTTSAQFQQVGIVSWGEGCARPDRPGVYTRVNRYLTWIERNTRDACNCHYLSINASFNMKRQLFILAFVIVCGYVTPRPDNENVTTLKPLVPPDYCPPCQCGIVTLRHRLLIDPEPNLGYPWMVELLYDGRFYCGGTLLNDLYVLTAAVCSLGLKKEKITARFFAHNRSVEYESKTFDRKILDVIKHPKHNISTYDNDIALLKLDKRVDLSNTVKSIQRVHGLERSGNVNSEAENSDNNEEENDLRPVCLPTPGLSYADYNGVMTGWGYAKEQGQLSDVLKTVRVPIMSNQDCRNTVYKNSITENMLCAGELQGGPDACQGDSGGPLHIFNTTSAKFQQVGIVSWGEGCGRPNRPGVYTRVNRYLKWIERNTHDACTCN